VPSIINPDDKHAIEEALQLNLHISQLGRHHHLSHISHLVARWVEERHSVKELAGSFSSLPLAEPFSAIAAKQKEY
jgi:hypothetical protein